MSKEKDSAAANAAREEFVKRFKNRPGIFIGTVVVLVLVIVSFVLVPAIVTDDQGGVSMDQLTFGYWDGKPISYVGGSYFYKMREYYARRAQVNLQYQIDTRMPSEYEIMYQAFNTAVVRFAALDIMKKSNYMPPDSLVNKKVSELPEFQENGHFSSLKYKQYPAADLISIWNETRDDLITGRYWEDTTDIAVSSKEADFISSMAKDQRRFKFASIPFDSYPDKEVSAYIEKHTDLFKVLHLSQITVEDEDDAKKIQASIKNGSADFAETARSQSTDSFNERGGDAGTRNAFEFDNLISSQDDRVKAASLKSGEISDVFKAYSGWVFFRAEEDPKDAVADDAVVIGKARSYMLDDERGLVEDYFIAQAKTLGERAAKANSFDAAAAALDIKVSEFGPLPINYGDTGLFNTLAASGTAALNDASKNENFWKVAFGTAVGTPSEPIVLSGQSGDFIAVIYPTEVIFEDTDALDNVKTTFKDYWVQQVTESNAERSIFDSTKLENNFIDTYLKLNSKGAY